jgi:hypothetical protein
MAVLGFKSDRNMKKQKSKQPKKERDGEAASQEDQPDRA